MTYQTDNTQMSLDSNKAEVERVHEEVNAKFPYATDQETFNQPEWWARISEVGKGDCEDYDLEKLERLRVLGWPIENLRMAKCLYKGEGHALLVVRIGKEQFALSNGIPGLMTMRDVNDMFQPVSIQEIGGSMNWVEWNIENGLA